jgi:hypothetical protein
MASSSFDETENADEDIFLAAETEERVSRCWDVSQMSDPAQSSRARWRRPALGVDNFS